MLRRVLSTIAVVRASVAARCGRPRALTVWTMTRTQAARPEVMAPARVPVRVELTRAANAASASVGAAAVQFGITAAAAGAAGDAASRAPVVATTARPARRTFT